MSAGMWKLLPFLLPLLAAGSFHALPFLAARVLFDGNRASLFPILFPISGNTAVLFPILFPISGNTAVLFPLLFPFFGNKTSLFPCLFPILFPISGNTVVLFPSLFPFGGTERCHFSRTARLPRVENGTSNRSATLRSGSPLVS